MKILRISMMLVLGAVAVAHAKASDYDDQETMVNPSATPAFLTSMPTEETSLFESAIAQKNVELETRIQRLESQLNHVQQYSNSNSYGMLERQLQQQDIGTGGLFGSVEVMFLKPHLSGAPAAFASQGAASKIINGTWLPNVRYVLGYRGDSGLGVRARYWSYQHTFNYVPPYQAQIAPPFTPAVFGIRMEAIDTEVTLDRKLRHFDMQLSGGIRYGNLQYRSDVATLFGVGTVTFEGIGPTMSIGGRRNLGDSGVSLFGNLRGSLLFGGIRNNAPLVSMPAGDFSNEVMTIADHQMGIAWNRNLSSTWQFEVRTAWETQYWMSSTLSDDVYGIGSNLALTGPTISVELRY